MKRSITLAIVLLATAALAGCGTGKYSQTANQVAPVPGFSQTHNISDPPGTIGVSNAHLAYPGPEGYKAGSDVPLTLWLFNNTQNPVTVQITTEDGKVRDGEVVIPVNGLVSPKVTVTGLSKPILPAESLKVRLDFKDYVVMEAILPVAPPENPLPRSPMKGPEGEGR